MKLADEYSANLEDVRSSSLPPLRSPRLNWRFSGTTPENVQDYGKTSTPPEAERTRTPDIAVGASTPPAYDPSRPTAFGSPTTSAIAYPR